MVGHKSGFRPLADRSKLSWSRAYIIGKRCNNLFGFFLFDYMADQPQVLEIMKIGVNKSLNN
jgi:hypothetical protein